MPKAHTFHVPGTPRGKGRPRFARIGKGVRAYTDQKTEAYESLVRLACGWKGAPLTGPVSLMVHAKFPYPKSWPKKRVASTIRHTGRPDLDNVCKAVLDGLNGVAWADDSQVVTFFASKTYTNGPPELVVSITEMED